VEGLLPLPLPSRVGRYRIDRRLGSGGMGVVYLGRDDDSGAIAAVKLIRTEHTADPQLRARLRREVAAARRVPRFCTAPVLDADLDADQPWVATEYIDGPTLDAALLERGRLHGTLLETFAVGVAVALQAIHQHGVVHRDLKPSNILLSAYGPRVIDFGIAQLEGVQSRLTRTGAVVGTPAYMAPEQLRGQPVTAAVDVFAWASLVTYAATGHPPFGVGDVPLRSILYEPPELGDLAGPLRELVTAAFAKDPAARPSTAELVEQLSAMAPATATQVLATAAAAPAAPAAVLDGGPALRRPRARTGWRLALVAASVVALVATAGAVALLRDGASAGQEAETRSRQLAAQAREADLTDPRRSMELRLDAWAAAPTAEARGALLDGYTHAYHGQLGTEPGGTSVAVDPAGTTVAVGHADGTVQLWDVASRQPVGEPLAAHGGAIYRTAFSPDGALLATASIEEPDGEAPEDVRVWEVATGRLRYSLPGIASVAWLPDGEALVTFALREQAEGVERFIGVWDAQTGQELSRFPASGVGVILDLAVSPDGQWVAGGRDDGTAAVWQVSDGSPVAEVSGHHESVVRVAFSPTGELATSGAEGEVNLWRLPGAGEPRNLSEGEDRTVGRLTFAPDGYLLATGGGSSIRVWETEQGWQGGWLVGFAGTPFDVATSADGKLVAATGPDGITTLWRRATYFLPHPDVVIDVAYDPAGDRFATAGEDGLVRIWDAATTAMTATISHAASLRSVAYSPDGTLASTSVDGTVQLHGPDGQEPTVLAVEDGFEARDAAFSPDGGLLAVSASRPLVDSITDYQIYLWETAPPRLRGMVELGKALPYALVFAPDGSRLFATTHTNPEVSDGEPERGELLAWSTEDLTETDRKDLGAQDAIHLGLGPDGDTLAIAGSRRAVELRNFSGDGPRRTLAEHPADIREVAFSPDGRTMATITTSDTVIRLWDVATGELLASLTTHGDTPNAIAFSPDGRTLASAAADGFVGLWVTDPDDAIARVCEILGPPAPDGTPPHPLCASEPTG
jgi:WD40 repeat protein